MPSSNLGVKGICLVLLTLQNSSLILVTRYSKSIATEQYLPQAAVVCSETVKLAFCVFMILHSGQKYHRIIDVIRKSLPLAVPGGVYFCQNVLQFVGLQYLDATTYSILAQLKILTAAVFSFIILRRQLTYRAWRALMLLVVGAILVQHKMDCPSLSSSNEGSLEGAEETENGAGGRMIGLMAVGSVVTMSGFAGVYTEKFLKSSTQQFSIWDRNLQLSFYGILFAVLGLGLFNREELSRHGFFYGFSGLTGIIVFLAAFGGFLVAMVMKYADAIVKGFASTCAIVVTYIVSFMFMGTDVDIVFMMGASCVFLAIFNYNDRGKPDVSVQNNGAPSSPSYSRLSTSGRQLTNDDEAVDLEMNRLEGRANVE